MPTFNDSIKDEIQKFYYDYLLVRILGWDVSYRPYQLVRPIAPELLKLSRHIQVPVREIQAYMNSYEGKRELLAFSKDEWERTLKGDAYDLLKWPDKFKTVFKTNQEGNAGNESVMDHLAYFSFIELEAEYAIARLFHLDANSGAPYRVLNHKEESSEKLRTHLGVSKQTQAGWLLSDKGQDQYVRRIEQLLRSLSQRAQAELFLNPHETIVRYMSDF